MIVVFHKLTSCYDTFDLFCRFVGGKVVLTGVVCFRFDFFINFVLPVDIHLAIN